MPFYEKHLKDDEQLIRIVRRYWLTFFLPLLFSSILILVPFFFLIPLFAAGTWGVVGFSVLLVIGIFVLSRNVAMAYFNSFILTDRRVIDYDQKGLFDRHVSEASFSRIQDVSYRVKGILSTALNYGAVVVQTAGSQPNLEIKGIKRPQRIQQLIVDLQTQYEQEDKLSEAGAFDDLSATELVGMVKKIKKGLGEEEFKELLEE